MKNKMLRFLFMLMLAFVGINSWAETALRCGRALTADEINAGGKEVILYLPYDYENKTPKDRYFQSDAEGTDLISLNQQNNNTLGVLGEHCVFVVETVEGGIVLKHKLTGKYVGGNTSPTLVDASSSDITIFTAQHDADGHIDGTFGLGDNKTEQNRTAVRFVKNGTQNTYLNSNGPQWHDGTGCWSAYIVLEAYVAHESVETSTADKPIWYTVCNYRSRDYLTPDASNTLKHTTSTDDNKWWFEAVDATTGAVIAHNANGRVIASKWALGDTPKNVFILENGYNQSGYCISATNPIETNSCLDSQSNGAVGDWNPRSATDWHGTTWIFARTSAPATTTVSNVTIRYVDENGTVVREDNRGALAIGTETEPLISYDTDKYTLVSRPDARVRRGVDTYTVTLSRRLKVTYYDDVAGVPNIVRVDNFSGETMLNGTEINTTFPYYTYEGETPRINTTDFEYVVELKNNFPFEVSPAPTAEGWNEAMMAHHWHLLSTRYHNEATPARYVTAELDDDTKYARTLETTRQLEERFLWAFVKVPNTMNEFYIYNMARGAGECLHVSDTDEGNGSTQNGANENFRATFNTNGATTGSFLVVEQGDFFNLRDPQDPNKNLGRHGGVGSTDGGGTYLAFWNNTSSATDSGSQFEITPVDHLCDFGVATEYNSAEYLGSYDETGASGSDDFTQIYTTYKNEGTVESLRNLIAARVPARVELNTNHYYQLIAYQSEDHSQERVLYANPQRQYDGSGSQERGLLMGDEANVAVAKSLVQFVPDAEGRLNYDIRFVNSRKGDEYYWLPDLATPSDGTQAVLVEARPDGGVAYYLNNEREMVNVWSLHCTTNAANYLNWGGTDNQVICAAVAPSEETNEADKDLWLVREVSEIPVTISAAGWATLHLPMDVVVPNDESCKVYYGSEVSGTFILLTQLEANTVLPANTAVLIEGEAGETYNFVINYVAEADYEENHLVAAPEGLSQNKLRGTNAQMYDMPTGNYFGLANRNDKVGFYIANTANMAANKVFITKSDLGLSESEEEVAAARGLAFNFGGLATGLSNVEADSNRPLLYDLNGRAVMFPHNGIYVTSDGKRVFVR